MFLLRMFNKDGGQSAVEFAATFLFFIVLIMTVLDLGRGIYAYTTIAAAAQSGARYGIVNPDDISGIQNAVVRNAIGLDPSNIVVSVSYPTSDVVAVTVRYDFAVITPLLEPMVGNNGVIRLEVTAAMQQY